MSLDSFPERLLQKAAHKLMSEPARVFLSEKGNRLQILSPGRINPHEGPDFLDIGILLNGTVNVGDAEFHRDSGDWAAHGHDKDARYNRVILHIVFESNRAENYPFDTLVIDKDEIHKILREGSYSGNKAKDIDSLDELQHFALLRLLRKSVLAQRELSKSNAFTSLFNLSNDFLEVYNSKRRRPIYNDEDYKRIVNSIEGSAVFDFIDKLVNEEDVSVQDMLMDAIRKPIAGEGAHLRRELVLNAVLPLALCLANEQTRINLFLWFWSVPALNKYGILSRKFENIPQNYLWQQQGMLEFLKEHGSRNNIIAEAIKDYGFAQTLSFYRLGRPPFKDNEES